MPFAETSTSTCPARSCHSRLAQRTTAQSPNFRARPNLLCRCISPLPALARYQSQVQDGHIGEKRRSKLPQMHGLGMSCLKERSIRPVDTDPHRPRSNPNRPAINDEGVIVECSARLRHHGQYKMLSEHFWSWGLSCERSN